MSFSAAQTSKQASKAEYYTFKKQQSKTSHPSFRLEFRCCFSLHHISSKCSLNKLPRQLCKSNIHFNLPIKAMKRKIPPPGKGRVLFLRPFPVSLPLHKVLFFILLFLTLKDTGIAPAPLSGTRSCSGKTCPLKMITPKPGTGWQLQRERF